MLAETTLHTPQIYQSKYQREYQTKLHPKNMFLRPPNGGSQKHVLWMEEHVIDRNMNNLNPLIFCRINTTLSFFTIRTLIYIQNKEIYLQKYFNITLKRITEA